MRLVTYFISDSFFPTQVHVIPFLDDNYAYLVVDPITKTAAAVDPGDPDAVLEVANGIGAKITHVLTTHGHW
jgi:hydroxyacylglutathione hydrolase